MTTAPQALSADPKASHPHEVWPQMRDPLSAAAEALAVSEGNLALFWGSESHRNAYFAGAAAIIRALEHRGWKLERLP